MNMTNVFFCLMCTSIIYGSQEPLSNVLKESRGSTNGTLKTSPLVERVKHNWTKMEKPDQQKMKGIGVQRKQSEVKS